LFLTLRGKAVFMPSISIDNQIKKYLPLLGSEEKKSILTVIQSFVKLKNEAGNNQLSVDEYNKEIDEAISRVGAGSFLRHEDVTKVAEKW
jgi:hypothetical protein